MQGNAKIDIDKQNLINELSRLNYLAESFDVDHSLNLSGLMNRYLGRIEKEISKIGKKSNEKKPVVSESLTAFIGDRVYKSSESKISIRELYSFYCERCRLKGIIPAKKWQVIKALKARFGNDIESKVVKIKGKVIRCYIGFDYKK